MIPAYPNGIGSAVLRAYAGRLLATLTYDEVIVLASLLWTTLGAKRCASDPVSRLQRKRLYRQTRARSGFVPDDLTPLGLLVRQCIPGRCGVVSIGKAQS